MKIYTNYTNFREKCIPTSAYKSPFISFDCVSGLPIRFYIDVIDLHTVIDNCLFKKIEHAYFCAPTKAIKLV